ncbi:hypothetical protein [Streptomyces nigra]|uniref:hypothetical protein n=1 Tax=Streptomyces nigra TaxID=1827580 RepID=UPI001ABEEC64|nr:hypothetical protein [Streptomyces nigra]
MIANRALNTLANYFDHFNDTPNEYPELVTPRRPTPSPREAPARSIAEDVTDGRFTADALRVDSTVPVDF